jgi:glycosyltransferase involved in cell wall biosynthesis
MVRSGKGLKVVQSVALVEKSQRQDVASCSPAVEHDWSRLPGVAFAFRFGNEDGFVHRFFAVYRDLVARELRGTARCFFAFAGPVGDNPVYAPRWAEEAQENLYDNSTGNRERISRFVTTNRIALIVFQGANFGEIDLGYFRRLGVKTITTEDHSFDAELGQSFLRTVGKCLLRRILKWQVHDLHIANSQGQYEFHLRLAQLPPQRLRTVRYGIDTNYYVPGNRRTACTQLGLDPEVLWIMAAAQARPEKRVDELIKVIRKVKDARPYARIGFFFVGGGFDDDRLLIEWNELAETLLATGEYRFFGKQRDMRLFYHAASIFIHAASKESFGLVLAEAMASGLPVIATRAHGPSDVIDEGTTGRLIERDGWTALAEAIISYIDNPELRIRHGEMGRRRCLELFSSDRQASELANLIRPFLLMPSNNPPRH